MKHNHCWRVMVLLLACLPIAACRESSEAAPDEETGPATVEHLDGATEPTRVTLTEQAVQRLDIQTAQVEDKEVGGTQRRAIPYAAVLYDTEGDTWVYTNPEPRVFVRHHILLDRIQGDWAFLLDGPASGLMVVTVGAEELYGSEIEFEEE